MLNRFGTDLLLDDNGDIQLKDDGDLLSTQDYENKKKNAKFRGYYSAKRAITNSLFTFKTTYPFDPDYGVGVQSFVSTNVTRQMLSNLSLAVKNELMKESRISEVVDVNSEYIGNAYVLVTAKVILIGDDTVSEFVFPEIYI